MSTMTDTQPYLTGLHISTVDAKPISVEWSGDAYSNEYREPAPFWEAFEYEHEDSTYTLVASGGSVSAVVIDGHPFTSWEDYAELLEEPIMDEDTFDDLMAAEPYSWGAEGPMMNYFYPIEESEGGPWASSFDPVAAAAKLADLPLCIVMHDDEYGMALTGGGMDFSWEICAAYVALGKMPPVHFRDLPAFASEWSESKELTYRAMLISLETFASWMQSGVERLERTRASMKGE